ncbi:hypothetical protein PPYR_13080 [Photinus pyralis]|uniref:C2H2-type domain-containing protein n=1 Tax=Photinus pyralis TaxID=7054 RepID=A0A1Y1MJU3_PHOPY|nr:uncharacterized protein LOC116179336 [Photinus pyralis]KAB0793460.1 hypothetical protein PPYR_13080 [Photinus pyralis]
MATEDSLIKVIPRNEPKDIVIVTIKEIFIAFLSSSKLQVHALDLTAILRNDCSLSIANVSHDIINLLIDGFLYYCKVWPGWVRKTEYLNGKIAFNVWHKQFKEYISYKCSALLDRAKKHLQQNSNLITVETQTEETSTDCYQCPYKLVIGGHPTIINNIAILTRDENIYIKQHPIKPWAPLTVAEFINWPFVAVELKLLDLHIERVNAHNFSRYITIDHSELNISDREFITHIKKHSLLARSYFYVYFRFYIEQLFEVLSSIGKISTDHLCNLKMICEQFLEDIREMNINGGSMQTHTTVGFHIGNFKYYRQKQIVTSQKDQVQDNKTIINLVEIIVPEVVCTLHHFHAVQDISVSDTVSFKSLNLLTKQIADPFDESINRLVQKILEDSVVYRCTFCTVAFSGERALSNLTSHFSDLHKVGHHLICNRCGGQFDMQQLVTKRWKHKCI